MAIIKYKVVINFLLLLAGTITSLSGIAIQAGYHFGNPDSIIKVQRIVLGAGYAEWCVIHKIAIIAFSMLCIYHIYSHRKWYKVILAKQLLRKKNRQVLTLTVIFFLSMITGIIAWMLDLSGTNQSTRILFIEIHDKISLILVVSMILHISRRAKRIA